jgi:TctA family transporter
VRGTAVGAIFGVLPGTGPALSSFAAYMLEKKLARSPRASAGGDRGRGGAGGGEQRRGADLVHPMLTLGIPRSATMALMVGAMTMHGHRARARR